MKNFVIGEEFGLPGCLGVGCLLIVAVGLLGSLVTTVGRRPAPPEGEDLRAEAVAEEAPRPAPPPEGPGRGRLEDLCAAIRAKHPLVTACDLVDTGDPEGPALFLYIGGVLEEPPGEEDIAALVRTAYEALPGQGTRPSTIAVDVAPQTWMIDTEDVASCLLRLEYRACLISAFTRLSSR